MGNSSPLRNCSKKSNAGESASWHEHDLAYHTTLADQLMRLSCMRERKSLRDYRLDVLVLQKAKQGDQVLSKPRRFQSLQRLNAVRDYTFAARKNPAARNVQPENGNSTKAMATAFTS